MDVMSNNINQKKNGEQCHFAEKDAVPAVMPLNRLHLETEIISNKSLIHESREAAEIVNRDEVVDYADGSNKNASSSLNVRNTNQQFLMQISNVNTLHLGSVYNINNNSYKEQSNKVCNSYKNAENNLTTCKKTRSIDLMMKSVEEPSRNMLDSVATHLGVGWRQVMRELGFSEGQISTSELDNNIHGTKEVIYQLLLDWLRNADDELRNIGFLTKILWNCGHRECVTRMKLIWKRELEMKNKI